MSEYTEAYIKDKLIEKLNATHVVSYRRIPLNLYFPSVVAAF